MPPRCASSSDTVREIEYQILHMIFRPQPAGSTRAKIEQGRRGLSLSAKWSTGGLRMTVENEAHFTRVVRGRHANPHVAAGLGHRSGFDAGVALWTGSPQMREKARSRSALLARS
jgi:hypothetical protein